MAGPKQHFIPQVFLRGFGKQGKGKAIQVVVYPKDRSIFRTSTVGVAAQRYFYSKPPIDGSVRTLDDEITNYEKRLTKVLVELRDTEPGASVDPGIAAEAVTHLCVRQGHIRDSYSSAAEKLVGGLADLSRTKYGVQKLFDLDSDRPSQKLIEMFDELYEKFKPQLNNIGITREAFRNIAFNFAKEKVNRNFPKYSELLGSLFQEMQAQAGKSIKEGQIKALEQGLVPEPRVEFLKQFTWRVEVSASIGWVLPDCVAISWDADEQYQPLMYSGRKHIAVLMPLSHSQLLIGERGEPTVKPHCRLNEQFAACSWNFFIARDRVQEFAKLVPQIGRRAMDVTDQAIESSLSKYR